jgi:hypothetical protein
VIALGYILAVVLAASGVLVIVEGWSTISHAGHLESKDVIPFLQVVVTFISAIVVAILTATFGRSNLRLQADLGKSVNAATETLKSKLTAETQASLAHLNSELSKSVAESTERLKADLVQSGDVFRAELAQLVPKRHAAYHAMWAAASMYFRALQKFEGGVFAADELKAANTSCEGALGQALLADQADKDTFTDFWQECNFLFEKGEDRKDTPPGLTSLWRNEGRNFGRKFEELQDMLSKRLQA